jgi:mevalonate kinase
MEQKKYHSKLLLFGEHTVNLGSQALAMPLQLFKAHWEFSRDKSMQFGMKKFALFLKELQENGNALYRIDYERFINDLDQGLIFKSQVPTGYGAGSSGALCAAIYDTYSTDKLLGKWNEMELLKQVFSQMESYFHGKSSGIDPLICYLNQPLLLTAQGATTVTLPSYLNEGNCVFLLDTGIKRKAEPLIHWFMEQSQSVDFQQLIKEQLVVANNSAIAAFLEGHWSNLIKATHGISTFQLENLLPLIPSDFISVWKKGIESDLFKLKICGAGGGGFILGFTKNFEETKHILHNYKLKKVFPIEN